MDTALARAIELVGGPAALARTLGITSQAISQWERVPVERAFEVERATGGKITAEELRPDFFGRRMAI
jgi:DNA-binding transcriptional regulator YdaS (Cro superfamily)